MRHLVGKNGLKKSRLQPSGASKKKPRQTFDLHLRGCHLDFIFYRTLQILVSLSEKTAALSWLIQRLTLILYPFAKDAKRTLDTTPTHKSCSCSNILEQQLLSNYQFKALPTFPCVSTKQCRCKMGCLPCPAYLSSYCCLLNRAVQICGVVGIDLPSLLFLHH